MATWAEDIVSVLEKLGGVAPLASIYDEVKKIRPLPHPIDIGASVRGTIESHSSDSTVFKGKDLFFSVNGIGGGVWGLRSFEKETPLAFDITENGVESPSRKEQKTYRILRDTKLARQIKLLHKNSCQLCGMVIELPNGNLYSEAHHIIPLGSPHNGSDTPDNIIVLCPNHHVMLDYAVILIEKDKLKIHPKHKISDISIKYHNEVICKSDLI